jgi:hypothetical protein
MWHERPARGPTRRMRPPRHVRVLPEKGEGVVRPKALCNSSPLRNDVEAEGAGTD